MSAAATPVPPGPGRISLSIEPVALGPLALDFIPKPFDVKRLVALVDSTLDRR